MHQIVPSTQDFKALEKPGLTSAQLTETHFSSVSDDDTRDITDELCSPAGISPADRDQGKCNVDAIFNKIDRDRKEEEGQESKLDQDMTVSITYLSKKMAGPSGQAEDESLDPQELPLDVPECPEGDQCERNILLDRNNDNLAHLG